MSEACTEANMPFKSVYHSLDSIFNVLKREEFSVLPEVQELVAVFKNHCPKPENGNTGEKEQHRQKPFIVLEGMDGSGKTTVTRELARALKGVQKRTPPQCLLPLRETFDKHPAALRRAYYGLGNYIAMQEIETLCREKPVVVDRFWHSSTAYAIATELDGNGGTAALPPVGDSLYNWPQDLILPDMVLLLTVDEEKRNERLARRQLAITLEEKQLKDNITFRAILLEAYKRMDNPALVPIDSNRTVRHAVKDIMKHISQKIAV